MERRINSSVSVDCVVFGFDGTALKVLLVDRNSEMGRSPSGEYKLPGSLIFQDESLEVAANRILENMTGLKNIFLRQMRVFSDPHRVSGEDIRWISEYYGVSAERVITVAYYSLLKLEKRILYYTAGKGARWAEVGSIKKLALDHKSILAEGLSALSRDLMQSPIAFELLPRRFTIRQLQSLYEAILGVEIDNRNFRKKILASGYISLTGDRETGVTHKPARFYSFNHATWERDMRGKAKLNFINWRI